MEVARFTLSLEELKKLSPGAKLPISINPRQVHLVVSGKSIGMGEIISLGDTVGVKVTTLYT
jgi:flagellar motor switch/type III secretory pathway protein FliN